MGNFDECRVCKPPRRYPGCQDHCPDYAKAKAKYEADKALADKARKVDASIRSQKYRGVRRMLKSKGRKWGE